LAKEPHVDTGEHQERDKERYRKDFHGRDIEIQGSGDRWTVAGTRGGGVVAVTAATACLHENQSKIHVQQGEGMDNLIVTAVTYMMRGVDSNEKCHPSVEKERPATIGCGWNMDLLIDKQHLKKAIDQREEGNTKEIHQSQGDNNS